MGSHTWIMWHCCASLGSGSCSRISDLHDFVCLYRERTDPYLNTGLSSLRRKISSLPAVSFRDEMVTELSSRTSSFYSARPKSTNPFKFPGPKTSDSTPLNTSAGNERCHLSRRLISLRSSLHDPRPRKCPPSLHSAQLPKPLPATRDVTWFSVSMVPGIRLTKM